VARRPVDGRPGVELVSGEAAVTVRPGSAFTVAAGAGRILVADGSADVRNDAGRICVTCLRGVTEVIHPLGRLKLEAGGQATYAGGRLDAPERVDLVVASAWRRGLLIFRDAPLQQVVDELNRYRNGRIVLVDPALAKRPVYGVFQIRQIATAVHQVQALTGAKATILPGGLVLLS
jgi:transmembrane sensor